MISSFSFKTAFLRSSHVLAAADHQRRPLVQVGRDDVQNAPEAVGGAAFGLLSDDERRLLCELAVFRGPFSLDGAAAVWSGAAQARVVEIVGSLVAKSLVVPLADSARYRLLETVRLFSLDQLSSEDRVADTRDRHLGWVRSFCAHGVIVAVPYADRVALGARQLSERAAYFEALDCLAGSPQSGEKDHPIKRDHNHATNESLLLGNDREDEVVVCHCARQIAQSILGSLPPTFSKRPTGADGNQRLTNIVFVIELLLPHAL